MENMVPAMTAGKVPKNFPIAKTVSDEVRLVALIKKYNKFYACRAGRHSVRRDQNGHAERAEARGVGIVRCQLPAMPGGSGYCRMHQNPANRLAAPRPDLVILKLQITKDVEKLFVEQLGVPAYDHRVPERQLQLEEERMGAAEFLGREALRKELQSDPETGCGIVAVTGTQVFGDNPDRQPKRISLVGLIDEIKVNGFEFLFISIQRGAMEGQLANLEIQLVREESRAKTGFERQELDEERVSMALRLLADTFRWASAYPWCNHIGDRGAVKDPVFQTVSRRLCK